MSRPVDPSKVDPLDVFAAWPTKKADASTAALIRYSLVRAVAAHALIGHPVADDQRQAARFAGHYGAAFLLAEMLHPNPAADAAAAALHRDLTDGDAAAISAAAILADWGIDPDQVAAVAREAHTTRQAEMAEDAGTPATPPSPGRSHDENEAYARRAFGTDGVWCPEQRLWHHHRQGCRRPHEPIPPGPAASMPYDKAGGPPGT